MRKIKSLSKLKGIDTRQVRCDDTPENKAIAIAWAKKNKAELIVYKPATNGIIYIIEEER